MRFWDASAIVPLLIAEASTRRLQAFAASDPDMLVWWGSGVECASALARLEREARDRKDLEIINRHADRLNREAMDTLEYQRLP